jgi:hypothetical protein
MKIAVLHRPSAIVKANVFRDFLNRSRANYRVSQMCFPPSWVLIAERFKFIAMGGGKFQHRRASLHRFRLEMKLTDDDMPADDAAN